MNHELVKNLQNFLHCKNFTNDDLKTHPVQFFAYKKQKFCEGGITKLAKTSQKVIKQNGTIIVD